MPTLSLSLSNDAGSALRLATDADTAMPPPVAVGLQTAEQLVAADTDTQDDFYAQTVATGEYTLVTIQQDGSRFPQETGFEFNGFRNLLIAPDGQSAAFVISVFDSRTIYVKDFATGAVTTVAGNAIPVQFSDDGTKLLIQVGSPSHLYVKDLTTGDLTEVGTAADGTVQNAASADAHMTPDGRYVVFWSAATNLVPGDTNGRHDVFRKDMTTGAIERVSITPDGVQGDQNATISAVSDDGNWIAFVSSSSNYVPGDANGATDVFLRNMTTGELILLSQTASGTPGNRASYGPGFSADDSTVVFSSNATDLVPGANGGLFAYALAPTRLLQLIAATDGQTVTFDPGDGSPPVTFGVPTGSGAARIFHSYALDGDYAATIVAHQPGQADAEIDVAVQVRSGAEAAVNLTGGAGVDAMLLSAHDDFADGGAGDDFLFGQAGDDTLSGGDGDDFLVGGKGADLMVGGVGNDRYFVDDAGDQVVESTGGGTDTVVSTVTYTLSDYIERLELTGTASIDGTGNLSSNVIIGNGGANLLMGLFGDDWLDGGAGRDRLIGGLGDDTYVIDNVQDVIVENPDEGMDTVRVNRDYTLGANLENLVLLGPALVGTGNDANNQITGNDGANTLTGGKGDDVLSGGAGDDILNGGTGADRMIGGLGNDTYYVGQGDYIRENADGGTDLVVSSISFTLGATLENLTLSGAANLNGTGNAQANTILGNSGQNVLYGLGGNDILNGNGGSDALWGGLGDDTYIYTLGATVLEQAGEGIDTVLTGYSYTLTVNVENGTLTGAIAGRTLTGNDSDNTLTGSDLADTLVGGKGDDRLFGGAGNDVLNGGTGSDRMVGGAGDDTYYVGIGDFISEELNGGTDTVITSYSFQLGATLENLTLITAAALDGTGNASANVITGNDAVNYLRGLGGADTLNGAGGNDVLEGGAGSDTLNGGAGADRFVYRMASEGGDVILGFEHGVDRLVFSAAGFGALTQPGPVSPIDFIAGTQPIATEAHGQFLYDTASGILSWDADGTGAGTAVIIAALNGHPAITASDLAWIA